MITGKSNLEFAQDILRCGKLQYAHYSDTEVFPLASYGEFFPSVLKDPHAMIKHQPELRETLQNLRSRNMRLFLGTNSHIEYMNVIMSTTLGPGWKELFDLQLSFCHKPGFFRYPDRPFYSVDPTTKTMRGPPITNGADLKLGNAYLEGNATVANQFYQKMLGKE